MECDSFRAMIPHVRNDSRAGLGQLGSCHFNGHCTNGGRNGGPFTEVSGTVEIEEVEIQRSPILGSSADGDDDVDADADDVGIGGGKINHIRLADFRFPEDRN